MNPVTSGPNLDCGSLHIPFGRSKTARRAPVEQPSDPSIRHIPVGRDGLYAIVDADMFEVLSRYNWAVSPGRTGNCSYAKRSRVLSDTITSASSIWMHRQVLGVNCIVDHINRNGLDNRRSNLRIANQSQNLANSRKRNSKSGLKGVRYVADCKKWAAYITVSYKQIYLGLFPSPEEAHEAYCHAARQHFGTFARFD
jgi:hypothetical protein